MTLLAEHYRVPIQTVPWTGRELRIVVRQLLSGALTRGPWAERLEAAVRARLGVKHALAVNSGRAALVLALQAVGRRERDEVIVPVYGCAAILQAVRRAGLVPRFADAGRDLNMDPAGVGALLSRRTVAVVVAHTYACPARVEEIVGLARACDVPVIDDAASALGLRTDSGNLAGTLGAAGVFSFAQAKTVVATGGGMLVTDDAGVWERVARVALPEVSIGDKLAQVLAFLSNHRYRNTTAPARALVEALHDRLGSSGTTAARPLEVAAIANVDAALAAAQLEELPRRLEECAVRVGALAGTLVSAGLTVPQFEPGRYLTRVFAVDPTRPVARTRQRIAAHGGLSEYLRGAGVETHYGYLPLDEREGDGAATAAGRVAPTLLQIPHVFRRPAELDAVTGLVSAYLSKETRR